LAQTIESTESFAKDQDGNLTPAGQASRWTLEFATARERLKKWHAQGEKIYDRYLDERDSNNADESRLNLFTANVETQHAMLYGKIPGADVARNFEDAEDDVARVAAEMLERLLEPSGGNDPYCTALGYALEDRLLPGFGFACARYEVETEQATDEAGEPLHDEAGEPVETKKRESVEVDYHYWKSVLWSPCRTHEEARWYAWSAPLTREAGVARFGDIFKQVPMNSKTGKRAGSDAAQADPWSRCDVWEIWCKEDRTVYWYVEGFDRVLDQKEDPLGLDGFFPFPKPMVARATTRSFVPRPDFVLAQDLYNEIDTLSTRISLLEKAIRVAGLYNKANPEVARLLSESGFNKMYAMEEWSLFVEKGGMDGQVSWFPLDQVTKAIAVLTEKRVEKIGLLQQVTGWSDIMRGQSAASETLGAQQLKAQYGSVRLQKFQGEFARFASDLQSIRKEIICKHFSPETIIERSNVMRTADAPMAQQAAQLIKDQAQAFRVEVKPDSINFTDTAAMKSERIEVITSLGGLMQAMAPLVAQAGAPAAEFALAAASWLMAGVKGGDGLEAEFDKFRQKVEQAAQQAAQQPKGPPPPDPKTVAAQAQAQATVLKAKVDGQKSQMDLQASTAEHGMRMKEIQAETAQTMVEAQAEALKGRWQAAGTNGTGQP